MAARRVAVTGLIGAGKTTVCQIFQNLGAFVVSADQVVHDLLEKNEEVIAKVIELLGDEIKVAGKLSREKMAEKVFRDPKRLEQLETLLHPLVYREIAVMATSTAGLFVAEVPLLFETGGEKYFDQTIAVVAKTRKNRFSDGREARHFSQEEKSRRADVVLENNGSVEALEKKVRSIIQQEQS